MVHESGDEKSSGLRSDFTSNPITTGPWITKLKQTHIKLNRSTHSIEKIGWREQKSGYQYLPSSEALSLCKTYNSYTTTQSQVHNECSQGHTVDGYTHTNMQTHAKVSLPWATRAVKTPTVWLFFCELLIQVCFHNQYGGEVVEKVRQ